MLFTRSTITAVDLQTQAFITECPASPIPHVLAASGKEVATGGKISASLYVTRACNLRCRTCYVSAGLSKLKELQKEDWERVIRQLREVADMVYFLGGEPLMRPWTVELVRLTASLGMAPSMSTNGFLMNREIARKLKDAGLATLQLSIDGAGPNQNDPIRGRGSFNAAIQAVNAATAEGLTVSLSYTVMDYNASGVKGILELAGKLGVNEVNLIGVQPFGRARENGFRLSRETGKAVIKEAEGAGVRVTLNGFRFYLPDFDRVASELSAGRGYRDGYRTCPAGVNHLVIDLDGEVYGCDLLMGNRFSEGNVSHARLGEIWRKGFNPFRERPVPPQCSACPYAACQGGCPARAFAEFGSLDSPDPLLPALERKSAVSAAKRRGSTQLDRT